MSEQKKKKDSMDYNILSRLEKDVKGALTTILVLGIIISTGRVWSFQIKKHLAKLYNKPNPIKNSSLYTLLGTLENKYKLIQSEWDEEVQRRYFKPTQRGKDEFKRIKEYWDELMQLSMKAFLKLEKIGTLI